MFASSGLVHKSEMSSCRVDNPAEIVDVGEQVWIKVIGSEVHSICMYTNTTITMSFYTVTNITAYAKSEMYALIKHWFSVLIIQIQYFNHYF